MVSELENQSGRLSYTDFMRIYIEFKKQEKNEEELREEALNAYVAMGGEENGGGNIDSDYLIDVIKNQFNPKFCKNVIGQIGLGFFLCYL